MASLQHGDPQQVGVYRILERLAVGGMGIVYLGESPGGRKVAVKLINPELGSATEFRARFRREVESARLVGGFHTAEVVDADPDGNPPWMVTQFVSGPSLDAKVTRDGPLEPAQVHRLAAALAEGLHAIHSQSLVHRDLKPLNIIMADDGPRIIDFGIAKAAGNVGDAKLTATGVVVGTPAFFSPEQLDDSQVGPPSDIFSLGSVIAFAATGRVPFEARTFAATSYAIVNKQPDLPPLPVGIRDIISSCLAKDPARRPTAADLLTYLYRTRLLTASDLGPAWSARPDSASAGRASGSPMAPHLARPNRARAAVRRRSLVLRAAGSQAPIPQIGGTQALLSQPVPPQVRPASQGWRLVTVGRDGRWLVSANGDGILTTWNAESGNSVRSWSAGARVRAMAAHADDLIVVATDCGRIQVWDPATGVACRYLPDVVPGLTGPTVRVRSVAADPSGTWLAASVDGRLLVWDVADPKEPLLAAGLPCPAEVTALAFDSTGWRLATGDKVGKVRVWDLAELAVAAPVNSAPGAAAFDGAPLETVSVSMPGTLPGASQPPSGSVLALAWDHTRNRWLNVSKTGPNGSVNGVGTANLGVAGVSLRAAALSPDGRFTAMIDDVKGRVYLAGMDDAARLRILDGTDRVITGVAFTESGRLALGCSDGRLLLWHRSEPSMKVIRPEGTPVTGVAASPNGSQVVISDKTSELKSFTEVKNSLKPGWVADSAEPEECLAFQADGTLLASAGDAVRTWNAANGTQAGVLPGRTGRVRESRLTTTASG